MTQKPPSDRRTEKSERASDLQPDERPVRETWSSPPEGAPGSVSANDTARPRDPEAVDAEEETVVGFTTTSPSGSMSGRSLYGEAPKGEGDIEQEEG